MRCPVDGETLVMTDRSGIEIDYCPKCRGVWLDRGELDKIVERSPAAVPARATAAQADPARPAEVAPVYQREPERAHSVAPRRRDDDDDDDDRYRHGGKPRRRESFLSDLFDF
jgi:uncharacterized protein